jgi:hypothetical protein
MIENKRFAGVLNYDDANNIIPSGHHKDALNIVFRGNQGNMRAENILGNTLVPNSMLPSGTNQTIGYHVDDIRKRLIFFNYNSNGNHAIYIYNIVSSTFQTLLQNGTYKINPSDTIIHTTNGNILNFTDANNNPIPITSVGIIYGDVYTSFNDTGGDILMFLDCLGIPTKINIDRYLAGKYSVVNREFIDLAKAPPQMPIKSVYENSQNQQTGTFGINSFFTGVHVQISLTGAISVGCTVQCTISDSYAGSGDGMVPPQSIIERFSHTVVSGDTVDSICGLMVSFWNGISGNDADGNIVQLYNATYTTGSGVVYVYLNSAATNNAIVSTSSNTIYPTTSVFVNNLRNKLFKFRYRFVYDDYEKSVWSSASETPLPNQDSSTTTSTIASKNSRIALYFSTGDIDVKKIELAVQITESGVTKDWQLLDTLDKTVLSIPNNTVYERYLFYNNSTLLPIAIDDANQLFDYVPQMANSMALLNGNVPVMGGILEGYDTISSNQSILNTISSTSSYIYSAINGALFFAQTNGLDSGGIGSQITFYLTGTGSNNSQDQPTDLSDVAAVVAGSVNLKVNMTAGSTDKSVSIAVVSSIATTLSNLSSALVAEGFTIVSTGVNSIVASYPTAISLFSSALSIVYSAIDGSIPYFSYLGNTAEYYGVQYFDSKGRTNGVVTNKGLKVIYPLNPVNGLNYPNPQVAQLQILHNPPSWASYYQIVRSQNLSYNKLLHWVTCGAGSDAQLLPTDNRFAYLNISNIADYNDMIDSTAGVVTYDFAPGDRVTIYGKYNSVGTLTDFTNPSTGPVKLYDYEVLGIETNPIFNGVMQAGTFLKILYPTSDIADGTGNLDFSNSSSAGTNFQNYKIVIYNLKETVGSTQSLFYEFGKCFGIGNAGTSTPYHIGLEQNQVYGGQPAIISINNGDYFFRRRNVLISGPVEMTHTASDGFGFAYNAPVLTIISPPSVTSVSGANYTIQNMSGSALQTGSIPTGDYSTDANFFFKNTSGSGGVKVRVRGTLPIRSQVNNSFAIYLQALSASGTYVWQNVLPMTSLAVNTSYQFEIDSTIIVPAGAKLRMFIQNANPSSSANIYVDPFSLRVDALVTYQINVLDASFSDYAKLETNSNGRATAIDQNAMQAFNGSLVRWGRPKQTGTNINETNRFFDLNYDEVDRQYGPIMRLDVNGQKLHIFQYRKCGVKGIYNKYIKNAEGQSTLTVTDQILTPNNVEYYIADFGIGNQPSSLVKNGYQYYFVDPVKGYILRLSQNGVEAISEVFKMQTFAGANLPNYLGNHAYAYGGYAKVVGVYNFTKDRHGEVIFCLQSASDLTGYTLAFDEIRNAFTSFYSFNADMMACYENQLISFKGGNLYIHNSATRNNFYGTQYNSYIKLVFNKDGIVKKTFDYLTIDATDYWTSPTMGDINTSLGQSSNLVQEDFEIDEGLYDAAFWMDNNSLGGLINGDYLKGDWIEVKLSNSATNLVYLSSLYLGYILSNRNT